MSDSEVTDKEIEVTPEMVEAGLDAVSKFEDDYKDSDIAYKDFPALQDILSMAGRKITNLMGFPAGDQ